MGKEKEGDLRRQEKRGLFQEVRLELELNELKEPALRNGR